MAYATFKYECGSLWLSQQISLLFLLTALPCRHAVYHLNSVAEEGWSCMCVGTASSQLMFQVVLFSDVLYILISNQEVYKMFIRFCLVL